MITLILLIILSIIFTYTVIWSFCQVLVIGPLWDTPYLFWMGKTHSLPNITLTGPSYSKMTYLEHIHQAYMKDKIDEVDLELMIEAALTTNQINYSPAMLAVAYEWKQNQVRFNPTGNLNTVLKEAWTTNTIHEKQSFDLAKHVNAKASDSPGSIHYYNPPTRIPDWYRNYYDAIRRSKEMP